MFLGDSGSLLLGFIISFILIYLANENFIQDLQARVAKLECLLIESSEEKDEMRETITSLSSEVSGLKVKIEFLEEENAYLKGKTSRKK